MLLIQETTMDMDIMHRHPIKPGLVAALLCALATQGNADLLMRDSAADVDLSTAGRWQTLAVSSAKSRIDDESGALTVTLAPGDRASLSRTANFTPEPSALLCRFNLTLADGTTAGRQVLRCGWDFGTSVTDESDASTYARLGVVSNGEGFQLHSATTQAAGTWFQGTQAVTWALNNSGPRCPTPRPMAQSSSLPMTTWTSGSGG
jgi:hypothetical protein